MAKGIIVVDVPERCDDCIMRHPGLAWCQVAKMSTSHTAAGKPIDESKRPSWCPIKEAPKKSEVVPLGEKSYVSGWNACVDEILKGEEK